VKHKIRARKHKISSPLLLEGEEIGMRVERDNYFSSLKRNNLRESDISSLAYDPLARKPTTKV